MPLKLWNTIICDMGGTEDLYGKYSKSAKKRIVPYYLILMEKNRDQIEIENRLGLVRS